MEELLDDAHHLCVVSFLSSLARQSAVSVVFIFSASLSDFVPLSPILLTVDLTRMEKGVNSSMDVICVASVFTTQIEFGECCVRLQCITNRCRSCVSYVVNC